MPFISASTAAIGLSIAGTLVSTIGTFQQMAAQRAQAEFAASVNRNNAIIAQRNADSVREVGKQEGHEQRLKINQAKGAAVAALAANGMLVDDEDPNATSQILLQDIAETGEVDVMRLLHNVELEALRAEAQGMNFAAQAEQNDLEASSFNPGFAAFGTLLGGSLQTLEVSRRFG